MVGSIVFIQMLCADLITGISHRGVRHDSARIKSMQSVLTREFVFNLPFMEFTTEKHLFADDVAIALLHLERTFPGIFNILSEWAKAPGLALKLPECSIIMAGFDKAST